MVVNIPQNIDRSLLAFKSIDLKGLDNVKLMNRIDTKAVFSIDKLPLLLDKIREDYDILEIEGKRISQYDSLYYDTPDLRLYTLHHNRKLNRYKIRYRKYVESGIAFFEIKFKSNKGRTIKNRIRVADIETEKIGEVTKQLLESSTPIKSSDVQPMLWVYFKRITLANKNLTERATIDIQLHYKSTSTNKETKFDRVVIAEIKQGAFSRDSKIIQAMAELGIRPKKISKYCMGILHSYQHVKRNRFKRKVAQLNALNYGDY